MGFLGDVGKLIVGAAATAVGVITGFAPLTTFGISMMASSIKSMLRSEQHQRALQSQSASTENAIPLIYGETEIGMKIADMGVSEDDKHNLIMIGVLSLCNSKIATGSSDRLSFTAIDEVYADDRLMLEATGWTASDGTRFRRSDGLLSDPPFVHHVRYSKHNGTHSTFNAGSTMCYSIPGWSTGTGEETPQYQGEDLVIFMGLFSNDGEEARGLWSGVPQLRFHVRGSQVYDPRTGSYGYSTNPALCLLDYMIRLRKYGGVEIPYSEIDEQSFIDAANYCDETVNPTGSNEKKRYELNGGVDTGQPVRQNLDAMASACRGRLIYQNGKFRLHISRPKSAVSFELTEDNIVENSLQVRKAGIRERYNKVICKFIDKKNKFSTNEAQWPDPRTGTSFRNNDNDFDSATKLQLPYTTDFTTAQQIAQVTLHESRDDIVAKLHAKPEALQLEIGDVVPVSHHVPDWTQKNFWVVGITMTPQLDVQVALKEYDANNYVLESQTDMPPHRPPPTDDPFCAEPPQNLTTVSDASTAVEIGRGITKPRIKLAFDPSPCPIVKHYEVQVKNTADSEWEDREPIYPGNDAYVGDIDPAAVHDIRIRTRNTYGKAGSWVSVQETASTVFDAGTSSSIDQDDGEDQKMLLTEKETISLSGFLSGESMELDITKDFHENLMPNTADDTLVHSGSDEEIVHTFTLSNIKAAVGDTVSARADVGYNNTSNDVRIVIRYRDSGGALLQEYLGNSVTDSWFSESYIDNMTIPANTETIEFIVENVTGTDDYESRDRHFHLGTPNETFVDPSVRDVQWPASAEAPGGGAVANIHPDFGYTTKMHIWYDGSKYVVSKISETAP